MISTTSLINYAFVSGVVITSSMCINVSLPDPNRTPGVINENVTQANIQTTICKPGFTKTIRPSAKYTDALKESQISRWKLSGRPGDYEEDHLISLELGGNPTEPGNLWPEAYFPKPGAKEKDQVENWLHKQVCANKMKLFEAQKRISTDWLAVYYKCCAHDPL